MGVQLQQSYSEMVEANLHRLKAIARSYADPQSREDLLQEMLYQLWKSFDSFEGASQLDTWVYRVALNTAINFMRSRYNNPSLVSGEEPIEPHHNGDLDASMDILEQFLQGLDNIDRAILLLYLDDIPHQQISEVIGQSVNVISVRINRMQNRFRQQHVDD